MKLIFRCSLYLIILLKCCMKCLKATTSSTSALGMNSSFKVSGNMKLLSSLQKEGKSQVADIYETVAVNDDELRKKTQNPKSSGNDINSKSPLKFRGWAKFFKYSSKKTSPPRAFFVNSDYTEQLKVLKMEELDEISENDYLNIRDKNFFYITIYDNQIKISRSRINFLISGFDVVDIHLIQPVAEAGFGGGINDLGSLKEGHCFNLKTTTDEIWIFCTELENQKEVMMTTIKKQVLKHQASKFITEEEKLKRQAATMNSAPKGSTLGKKGVELKNILDGYWIVLQDWSTCTKLCGVGTQTLQRLCVPPKQGGAPCEGEAIMTKECNIEPCPETDNSLIPTSNRGDTLVSSPQMQVLPFSPNPQRYDKCFLKESDLLMTSKFPNGGKSSQVSNKIQIPVRLVMNNETISASDGFDEQSQKISFSLQKSKIQISPRDSKCFVITEIGREIASAEFCAFGLGSSQDVYNEWSYDFNLFKYQCHQVREISYLNQTEIQSEIEKKAGQMRIDLISKKKEKVAIKQQEDTLGFQTIKKNALSVIKKENQLEKLVEQEVLEAQQEAMEEKLKEVEKEKCKVDILNKAIKMKDIENQFNLAKENSKKNVENIEKKANEEVVIKREKFKQRLKKLRSLEKNNMENLNQEIKSIRLELVNSLDKNEQLNPAYCKINSGSFFNDIKNYCEKKFYDSKIELGKCLTYDISSFPNYCCDIETNSDDVENFKMCVNNSKLPEEEAIDYRVIWGRNQNFDLEKVKQTGNEIGKGN